MVQEAAAGDKQLSFHAGRRYLTTEAKLQQGLDAVVVAYFVQDERPSTDVRAVCLMNSSSGLPRESRAVSVALVDQCFLRLYFHYYEVVVRAEAVIGYSISWLQVLPERIDDTGCVPALRHVSLHCSCGIPTTSTLAKLLYPRPDHVRRSIYQSALVVNHYRVWDYIVAVVWTRWWRWHGWLTVCKESQEARGKQNGQEQEADDSLEHSGKGHGAELGLEMPNRGCAFVKAEKRQLLELFVLALASRAF